MPQMSLPVNRRSRNLVETERLPSVLVATLLILAVFTLILVPQVQQTIASVNWSQLRGVNYNWSPLWTDTGGGAPAPSASLPEMQANGGMNFVRQPIFWSSNHWDNSSDISIYLSALQTLANEADKLGFSVVYDFHSGSHACGDCTVRLFPTIVETDSRCTGDPCFIDAYETNGFDVGSQSVWAYQMTNFWEPIIEQVDSHPSTIGYELWNEPPTSGSTLEAYHTYFANQMRDCTACGTNAPLTDKAIVFGSADYDTEPSSSIAPPAADCNSPYAGCVIDVHLYQDSDPTNVIASFASTASSMGDPIILGEFGLNSGGSPISLSNSQAQTLVHEYVSAAKNYGLGIAKWYWNCYEGTDQAMDWDSLLTPSCGTNTELLTLLASAYNTYFGNSTSSTMPTSSTTNATNTTAMTSVLLTTTTTTTTATITIVTSTTTGETQTEISSTTTTATITTPMTSTTTATATTTTSTTTTETQTETSFTTIIASVITTTAVTTATTSMTPTYVWLLLIPLLLIVSALVIRARRLIKDEAGRHRINVE